MTIREGAAGLVGVGAATTVGERMMVWILPSATWSHTQPSSNICKAAAVQRTSLSVGQEQRTWKLHPNSPTKCRMAARRGENKRWLQLGEKKRLLREDVYDGGIMGSRGMCNRKGSAGKRAGEERERTRTHPQVDMVPIGK